MKVKEQLLNFEDGNYWKDLTDQVNIHVKSKSKTKSDIEEALAVLSRPEKDSLWNEVLDKFTELIQKYFARENSLKSNEVRDDKKDSAMICTLVSLASIQLDVLVEEKRETESPEGLAKFVILLGTLLLNFTDTDIKDNAVKLTEKWIQKKRENHEIVLENTFTALLQLCLKPRAKKVDVKRAYAVRAGLDYLACKIGTSAEENWIEELLLSCASNPVFLGVEEGVKLLSLIFAVPELTLPFHQVVKRNLLEVTKTQSVKYAEVYFRAWKNNQDDVKLEIEKKCLQDLMYLGVHVDPAEVRLSTNLTAFLHYIHQHKKHLPTASVIYSLYEPFLWRSLKVANGYVRMNAAAILCDLFPCSDSTLNLEDKENLMTAQYEAFAKLLVDPCHWVRIAAIKGVFSILSEYWVDIPPNVIQKLFQIFINKLAVDASSAEIRMLVIQGVMKLLDCPDAGPFISDILPHICGAFDDVNTSVRIAFMKLMLRVKATRFIKYWKLIPMEHLLNRLAHDGTSVKKFISQLLSSSFLPTHLSEQDKLQRCISLIEMNRDGARCFFLNVGKKLDLEAATRFISCVWTAISRYVQVCYNPEGASSKQDAVEDEHSDVPKRSAKKSKSFLNNQSPNKENEDESEEPSEMPLDNPEIVGGLLDVIVILWTMNAPRLSQQQNLKYLDHLRTRVSRGFPLIWSFFKENLDISKTLIYLSSFLPKSQVPLMVSLCLSRLKEMPDVDKEESRFGTYVNALCNWNRISDLMELITEWIEAAFDSAKEKSRLEGTNKSKEDSASQVYQNGNRGRVCFQEKHLPKPVLGLRILDHVLKQSLNRINLLQNNRTALVELSEQMAVVKDALEMRLKSDKSPLGGLCSDHFLLRCWTDYLVVLALLNRDPSRVSNGTINEEEDIGVNALESYKNLVLWMQRIWTENRDTSKGHFDHEFYFSCSSRCLGACADLIALGITDEEFADAVLTLDSTIIKEADCDLELYQSSVRLISQLHFHLNAFSKTHDHIRPPSSVTCQALCHVLESFSDKNRQLKLWPTQNLDKLADVLSAGLTCLTQDVSAVLKSLTAHSVKVALDVLTREAERQDENLLNKNDVSELTGAPYVIMVTVAKRITLLQPFAHALIEYINTSGEVNVLTSGMVLVWLVVKNKKLSKAAKRNVVREMRLIVENFEQPIQDGETSQVEISEQKQKLQNKIEEMVAAVETTD